MIKKILFPKNTYGARISLLLFVLRVVFAGMLVIHGWEKLIHFETTAQHFASMGGAPAAALCIFAEFFCALGVVVGLLYRLALIPIIINMSVAFFIADGARLIGNPVGAGELAFLYLVVFVVLIVAGSGKFALDNFLFNGKKR